MSMAVGARIRLEHVSKVFVDAKRRSETVALGDVSFGLKDNEILCLLGPSGCGKTTVLNIIAGFEAATSGIAYLNEQPITRPGPDRGVVFQEHLLFPWLTVAENISFGLRMRGQLRQQRDRVQEYVRLAGLTGFERHFPDELSGGMRQRVAIARVLINDPQVLLMDEPFGALDAQTRLVMQQWLLQVWQDHQKTILFITHDVDEAIFIADRVLVMGVRPGRIIAEIPVPISRPRGLEVLTTAGFNEIKRTILQLIREESAKAFSAVAH